MRRDCGGSTWTNTGSNLTAGNLGSNNTLMLAAGVFYSKLGGYTILTAGIPSVVPEPGVTSLGLLALFGWLARRGFARRSGV